jgi:hypothetical protein
MGLVPAIPATWEADVGGLWLVSETLSQKQAGCGDSYL